MEETPEEEGTQGPVAMAVALPVIFDFPLLPYFRFHAAFTAHAQACALCLDAASSQDFPTPELLDELCSDGVDLFEDAHHAVHEQWRTARLN